MQWPLSTHPPTKTQIPVPLTEGAWRSAEHITAKHTKAQVDPHTSQGQACSWIAINMELLFLSKGEWSISAFISH